MSDSRYLSKEFIIEFLEKYRQFPCLWKIKSKDYTNKNLKNRAYDELLTVCKNINPEANRDFVVKKIQSFRGSFRKELKKVEDSKRSGKSADDVHVPTLWYYHLLEFTVDQELPTDSISNFNNTGVNDDLDSTTGDITDEVRQKLYFYL
jgi:predicted house-cleaning noncanonical NTP pyrophosphatase (MazG superfamily)